MKWSCTKELEKDTIIYKSYIENINPKKKLSIYRFIDFYIIFCIFADKLTV